MKFPSPSLHHCGGTKRLTHKVSGGYFTRSGLLSLHRLLLSLTLILSVFVPSAFASHEADPYDYGQPWRGQDHLQDQQRHQQGQIDRQQADAYRTGMSSGNGTSNEIGSDKNGDSSMLPLHSGPDRLTHELTAKDNQDGAGEVGEITPKFGCNLTMMARMIPKSDRKFNYT